MSLAEARSISIHNLYTEMQNAYNNDLQGYEWLTSKCNNQESLASVSRKGKQIVKMSVNTFKKYAESNIDGGFGSIDSLRCKISQKYNGVELTLDEQKLPVNKLEEAQIEIDKLKRNQAVLIKAYNDLNRITLDLIAKDVNGNTLDYQNHQDLFSRYFGLDLAVDSEN